MKDREPCLRHPSADYCAVWLLCMQTTIADSTDVREGSSYSALVRKDHSTDPPHTRARPHGKGPGRGCRVCFYYVQRIDKALSLALRRDGISLTKQYFYSRYL